MPATHMGYCNTFGIMMATRSPRPSPRLCSHAASALDISPSWP
jgi:hypothetical protein